MGPKRNTDKNPGVWFEQQRLVGSFDSTLWVLGPAFGLSQSSIRQLHSGMECPDIIVPFVVHWEITTREFIMHMRTRNSLPVGNKALFYLCKIWLKPYAHGKGVELAILFCFLLIFISPLAICSLIF